MERVLPPSLPLSQLTRTLDQWMTQGGLILLYGDQAVLTYSLQAVASLLARGEHVVFIDSANAFNPFLIAEADKVYALYNGSLGYDIEKYTELTLKAAESERGARGDLEER